MATCASGDDGAAAPSEAQRVVHPLAHLPSELTRSQMLPAPGTSREAVGASVGLARLAEDVPEEEPTSRHASGHRPRTEASKEFSRHRESMLDAEKQLSQVCNKSWQSEKDLRSRPEKLQRSSKECAGAAAGSSADHAATPHHSTAQAGQDVALQC